MAKIVGRKPVEIKISSQQDGYVPVFNGSTRLWEAVNKNDFITGSATISGSNIFEGNQTISGSLTVYQGITGSLFGTSSYADNAWAVGGKYFTGGDPSRILGTLSDHSLTIYTSGSRVATFTTSGSFILSSNIPDPYATEKVLIEAGNTTSNDLIKATANINNYSQFNIQNLSSGSNASSDIVATANNGSEIGQYVNMGINSNTFTGSVGDANDAYLYSTGNDLHIGNASNHPVQFFAGGLDNNANRKLQLNPDNLHQMTGSLDVSGSIVAQSFTGSLQGTSSVAVSSSYASTASYVLNSISASYSTTASSADDFTVRGTLTAQTIVAQTITSSVEFITGSTRNGSLLTNTHQFTGSVGITGSLIVNGENLTSISSSLASRITTDSSSFEDRIATNSSSFASFSGSYVNESSSFASRVTTNSSSFASFSGSYINDSSSFASRIVTNSSSFVNFSGSYVNESSSFADRIRVNSSSFASFSGSYVNESSSFASRVATNSGSFASFSGSYVSESSSFASRTATNSASISSLSASFLSFSNSYNTGSFTGSFKGDGSGLINISASNVVGLNVSQIFSGSVTASISPNGGFKVNTDTTITGSTVISGSLTVSGSTNIIGTTGNTLLTSNADTLVFTGSLYTSGSIISTGSLSINGGITGSLLGTASYAAQALTSSNANTASSADNFTVRGTLTAQTINVQTITSSVDFVTGSSINGSLLTNTHQFTGSVDVTGSLTVNGRNYINDSSSFASQITTNSSSLASFSGSYVSESSSFASRITTNSSSFASFSGSYVSESSSLADRITTNSSSFTNFSGSYVNESSSFASRVTTNSSSFASFSGSYISESSSFAGRVTTNSSSFANFSGSYVSESSSFAGRVTTNSSSFANFSGSYVSESSSFAGRVTTNSSSFASFSGSYVNESSSFASRIATNSSSFASFSGSYVNESSSFASKIAADSASFTNFSGSYINESSSFASRITTNSASIASLSSSFNSLSGSFMTGSFTGSFIGLLSGTASYATQALSASYWSGSIINAATASYIEIAQTASYVSQAQSASYWSGSITNAATASYVLQAVSASYALTASNAPNYLPLAGGTMTGDIYAAGRAFTFQDLLLGAGTTFGKITTDGSKYISIMPTYNVESARFWANGNVTIQDAGTYVDNGFRLDVSGSGRFTNGLTVTGSLNATNGITGSLLGTASQASTASSADDFTVRGTLTAQTIVAQTITSSTEFITGSTKNGSLLTNTHQFTGSVGITGSLSINGSDYITTSGSASTRLTTLETFSGSYSTGSFTGSFIGRHTGSFSGSLYNLQNSVLGHIPFFSASQVLTDSVVRQLDNGSGSYSVVINQDNITTAAPEALYVWQPSDTSFNVIAGKGNLNNYLQLNIQNLNTGENASSDVVATANNGNESINYIDMGINSEGFTGSIGDANDAYLYSTGNHLHIGNASNQYVGFFAGGHDVDTNMKLLLDPNNSHEMTGSLSITNKLVVLGGVTASLQGTASWANSALNANSASNAVTASLSLNAISASYAAQALTSSNANTASYIQNAQSASYVLNAISASYAGNADLLDGKDSTIFATTGSNIFVGNQTITGSFAVSGSTTQIGNNTLLGNTTLSGSIIISGSVNALANINLGGTLRLDPTEDPGSQNITASFLFTSASNTATGFDLYYRQNNNLTKFKWLEGSLNTGILYGGVLTYSSSYFYLSAGSGIIVNHNAVTGSEINPIVNYVTWNASTHSIANTGSQNTYVFIDTNGDLQQQTSFFTAEQYHDILPIGRVSHYGDVGSIVTGVGNNILTAYDVTQQLGQFTRAFGPLKISGFTITPQVGNLSLNIGSGTAFNLGGYYQTSPDLPSTYNSNTYLTSSIIRLYRSGSGFDFDNNGGSYYTSVDPTLYDDGTGTLATVGGGNWSIQRVFVNPITGRSHVYYGQSTYTTYLNAVQSVATDDFVESEVTKNAYVFAGYLVMKGGAANDDLSVGGTTNAIVQAGLFRNSVGGSGGATTAVSELGDLSDVNISSPSNGQALIYSTGTWINGTPASASTATSASHAITAISASYFSGSVSDAVNAISASYAATASYANNLTVAGTLTAQTINVQTITSSIEFNTGSTRNGSLLTNTHQFTGSVGITGSLTVNAPLTITNNNSSNGLAFGSQNWYIGNATANLNYNGGVGYSFTGNVNTPFKFGFTSGITVMHLTGSTGALILGTNTTDRGYRLQIQPAVSGALWVSGSTILSGSVTSTNGFTGSLLGTASNAVTSSFAQTASFAQTSSYSLNAVSSSFAQTASYASDFTVANTLIIDQTLTDYHVVPSSAAGENNMFDRVTGSYSSGFFKYTVSNGANARTGEVMAVWNNGSIQYTDNSTVDIGDTSAVTASAVIVSNAVQFNLSTATSGWKLKSLGTFM